MGKVDQEGSLEIIWTVHAALWQQDVRSDYCNRVIKEGFTDTTTWMVKGEVQVKGHSRKKRTE